jgi:hypothetical protein
MATTPPHIRAKVEAKYPLQPLLPLPLPVEDFNILDSPVQQRTKEQYTRERALLKSEEKMSAPSTPLRTPSASVCSTPTSSVASSVAASPYYQVLVQACAMETEDSEFDSLCVTSLQQNFQQTSQQIQQIWSSRRTRRLPLKSAFDEAVKSFRPKAGSLPTVQEDFLSEEEDVVGQDVVSQDDGGKGPVDGIGKGKRSTDNRSTDGIAADSEPMVKKSRVASKRSLSLIPLDADGGGKQARPISCNLLGPFYILTVTPKHTFCVSAADNGLYAVPLAAPRSKTMIGAVAAVLGKTEDPMFQVVAGLENRLLQLFRCSCFRRRLGIRR